MRKQYLAVALLVLAAIAAFAAKRLIYTPSYPLAAPIAAPAGQTSYIIALGVGDNAPTVWDGSITATGATIVGVTGWRFSATDAISGSASAGWSWKASTRTTPSINPPGPFQETGVIVTASAATGPITFNVTTKGGDFSFASTDVPFGTTKFFLPAANGSYKAHVMQT